MDVWLLLLYGGAAYLAVQSLVSLMVQHKRQYRQQLIAKELAERKKRKRAQRKRHTADTEGTQETKESPEPVKTS